jgi:hypothetical protein
MPHLIVPKLFYEGASLADPSLSSDIFPFVLPAEATIHSSPTLPIALHLPEIVYAVLQHLHDDENRPALCAAIRVNRTWFAAGIDMLWSEPSRDALSCVATTTRRQFYADRITTAYNIPAEVVADGLRLPRLWLRRMLPSSRAEDDEGIVDVDVEYARQLRFVPGPPAVLEELRCDLTPALLRRLGDPATLPLLARLRALTLLNYVGAGSGGGGRASLENFVDWLAQPSFPPLPALRALCIDKLPCSDAAVMDRAFGLFAHWPGLQKLELKKRVPPLQLATVRRVLSSPVTKNVDGKASGDERDDDDVILRRTARPFEHLRVLEIAAESEAVPALAGVLSSITQLKLDAHGPHPVLPAVAALTRLRSLSVRLAEGSYMTASQLLSLCSLTQLRALSLSCGSGGDGGVPVDCRRGLVTALGALGSLGKLVIAFDVPSSLELLAQIGRACQRLHTLVLLGTLSLGGACADSNCEGPVFPQLQKLVVRRLQEPPDGATRYAQSFLIPHLFANPSPPPFDNSPP